MRSPLSRASPLDSESDTASLPGNAILKMRPPGFLKGAHRSGMRFVLDEVDAARARGHVTVILKMSGFTPC